MRRLAVTALALLALPATAQAAWPGGNGAIVWSSGGDLIVGGENITNTPGADEAQASWSPDGTRLAFRTRESAAVPFRIGIVNADGSGRVEFADPGGFNETQPGWTPDGRRLVFRRSTRGEDLSGDIWSMAADGTDRRAVITSPDDERYPAVAPYGTELLFTRNVGLVDIWIARTDGTDQRPFITGPERESAPSWDPFFLDVAFERGPAENSPANEIWIRTGCRGEERRLTSDATLDEGPAWSPRGDAIAFTSARDGTLDIFRMQRDGSDVTRITTAAGDQESPDWQASPPGSLLQDGCGFALPPPPPPPPPVAAADADADGLDAFREGALRTSDLDRDSDDDGLSDAREAGRTQTSPARFDTDRDRLSDGLELGLRRGVADPPGEVRGTDLRRFRPDRQTATRTHPLRRDTDRDGLSDGREDRNRNGRRDRGERDPTRRGR